MTKPVKAIRCCLHTCSCGERLPILKAQQRVIRAAKRWRGWSEKYDHKLCQAIDALLKLEKESK